MSFSTILHKRNSSEGIVPSSSALSAGEIAINTADGKLFTKTIGNSVKTFLNSEQLPYLLNSSLSSVVFQYGNNSADGVLAAVLGGMDNNVNGAGSTVVNGSDNDIDADYAFIGNGSNNTILSGGDFGGIFAGQNNTLNHQNSFILGSNITSHATNFTYVDNLSVVGNLYGDGSNLFGVAAGGDRYFTTSSTSNSITKGIKIFTVDTGLAYIPTQDITIVYDHEIDRHMHAEVIDYNTITGILTADVKSTTGSGTYADWRINIGGILSTFSEALLVANNLSDIANASAALAHLSGVSKSELASLSSNWQNTFSTVQTNSATNWNYQGTDLKGLSANWQSTYLTVSSLSAQWSAGGGSSSDYLPLTGGNLTGTLTVQGNVSAANYLYGDGTFITGLAVEGNTVSVSDPLKFKYTGNGSTKSFQVSGTSNSTNANLVRVHVDNVVQEPYTAYTLSFSAVEFVVAPANGQSIYIITPNVSIGGEPARRFDFVVGTPASFSYSGVAEANSLITQPVWTITRIAYTSVGEISATQYASNVTWSGRLTATYIL